MCSRARHRARAFSQAGFRSRRAKTGHRVIADDRNYLYHDVVRAAIELRPRVVVIENVPGMHSARRQDLTFLQTAARDLERRARFRTAMWRLNASAFGSLQDRVRYFLVAWPRGPRGPGRAGLTQSPLLRRSPVEGPKARPQRQPA
jgi:DNA (cytosine-5)-methyltransferase 1